MRGARVSDFASRLTAGAARYGPLCAGIDPHPGAVPDMFGGDTPAGLENWGRAFVEVAIGRVAAVKPQVAFFERLGPEGMAALAAVTQAARAAGLVVIMDAKRGDIGSTAEGYAAAYLSPGGPFEADAVTLNPYMGLDTLEPFARIAAAEGKGIAVLVRTSNPGAADFQSLTIGDAPLYLRVAEALAPLTARLMSPCGWSNLMMVAGATAPEEARRLRAVAPAALFLIPGYGAQGAAPEDSLAGLVNGQGGVVNASRAVNFPEGTMRAATIPSWQDAVAAALEAAQADLKSGATA